MSTGKRTKMRRRTKQGSSSSWLRLLLSFLLLGLLVLLCTFSSLAEAQATHHHHHHPTAGYAVGQEVKIECKAKDGSWGPGPICQETGKEMTFSYGVDSFQYCGLHVATQEQYEFFSAIIQREANWNCRLAMFPIPENGASIPPLYYLPFSIPLWGMVEQNHFHFDNHLNFIFHAMHGKILGAAAYPVGDRFQVAQPGSVITVHGNVKWFNGHTYLPFSSNPLLAQSMDAFAEGLKMAIFCGLSFLLSATFFAVLYRFYLRKRLVQKLLKVE
ncbi:polyprotein [Balamuthia mandrillaris]